MPEGNRILHVCVHEGTRTWTHTRSIQGPQVHVHTHIPPLPAHMHVCTRAQAHAPVLDTCTYLCIPSTRAHTYTQPGSDLLLLSPSDSALPHQACLGPENTGVLMPGLPTPRDRAALPCGADFERHCSDLPLRRAFGGQSPLGPPQLTSPGHFAGRRGDTKVRLITE